MGVAKAGIHRAGDAAGTQQLHQGQKESGLPLLFPELEAMIAHGGGGNPLLRSDFLIRAALREHAEQLQLNLGQPQQTGVPVEQILQHGAMGLPEMEGCHGLGIIEAAPAGKDLPLGEGDSAEEAAVLSIAGRYPVPTPAGRTTIIIPVLP